MYVIDSPKQIPLECYSNIINQLIEKMIKINGIISIIQIGSVSTPGISDIDLIVVFENDFNYQINPRSALDKTGKYLFIHGLFGSSEDYFIKSQKFTFFNNYKVLWGKDFEINKSAIERDKTEILQRHIASEYLIKLFIVLSIEQIYRLTKARTLLLEIKAAGLDLDTLNIKNGRLFEMIKNFISMRQNWFSSDTLIKKLQSEHAKLHHELYDFLKVYFQENPLRFSTINPYKIGRNVTLNPGRIFSFYHQGVVPTFYHGYFFGRRYFNLLHRFNKFNFTVPGTHLANSDDLIAKRFIFQEQCRSYNKEHLPYFAPLVTGLGI